MNNIPDNCSICLEEIGNNNKDKKVSLICGHSYHSKCILEWYEKSNNGSCPYCRQHITNPVLYNFTEFCDNIIYKMRYKRRSVYINGKSIAFINKLLLNDSAIPYCWILTKDNFIETIFPVYSLSNIKISFYARLYILYGRYGNITLTKKITLNNIDLYDIDKPIIGVITKKNICLLFEWVYDVIFELKHHKYSGIIYHSINNTFIFDLFFVTLKHFKLYDNTKILQGIITCCIYCVIKYIDRIKIKFTDVLYYTNNAYTYDDISNYIDFQREYIEENVTFLKKYRFSSIY
jgi:hypothetical protein